MIALPGNRWQEYLEGKLTLLLGRRPIPFKNTRPLPKQKKGAVYLITAAVRGREYPYYVGRTKNVKQRVYTNHLMGSFSNARLKNYLVKFGECDDIVLAKRFIIDRCSIRWIPMEDYRKRGLVEGYITGKLRPKYGISEEH